MSGQGRLIYIQNGVTTVPTVGVNVTRHFLFTHLYYHGEILSVKFVIVYQDGREKREMEFLSYTVYFQRGSCNQGLTSTPCSTLIWSFLYIGFLVYLKNSFDDTKTLMNYYIVLNRRHNFQINPNQKDLIHYVIFLSSSFGCPLCFRLNF